MNLQQSNLCACTNKRTNDKSIKLTRHAVSLACAVAFFYAGAASAFQNVPAPAQKTPLFMKGATIHTVSGDSIVGGEMLIDQGKIVAIGRQLAVPTNAKTVDVTGKHIYPGMIVANSVVGISEVQSVRATADFAEAGSINPNARAVVAVNADSELVAVARTNGVLAALAVPQPGPVGMINGISSLMQLDGWTWEDMAVKQEVALHITLPHMRFNADLFPPPLDSRLEEMRKSSADRIKMLEDAFDMAIAYRDARLHSSVEKMDVRWEAMIPVLNGSRPVFIQAQDVAQIRYALNFAERYQLKLVIVGGYDAHLMADVLRTRNVPVIIDGVHKLPIRRGEAYDMPFSLAGKLSKAGVQFCIARGGSDNDGPNERNLPYEAGTAVSFGLDKKEALKAITLYPAQILGVADQLGSLEVGKLANFFVTDGDPLETATKVERIYIQGRVVDGTTLQSRLTDKYQQRYLQKASSSK